jgi:16S rRNA (adenine1518-N6/adenine1519-N6)-dimethyltransferase
MVKYFSSNRSNKFMGQHFLKSKKVLVDIVDAANISHKDIVLEIGPGKGMLTSELLKYAKKVIAIEKDPKLFDELKEKYKDESRLELIKGDILKTTIELPKKYKIVSNIPYYLTSHLIRKALAGQADLMILLVQYEVAKRIVATPPNMNLLGLSVQVYADAKLVKKVSRSAFAPQPKVDSAIISIKRKEKSFFESEDIDEQKFFKLVKKAFSQKRKKIRNSIGVDSEKRPQELSLINWACFLRAIIKY